MAVKRVVVTGANSGMGKAISVAMAVRGYDVIMLCRNEKRGLEALEEVKERSRSSAVTLELCDLASFESILQCVNRLKERYSAIDILINNAGLILTRRQETKDGFEMQIGVNHFGHFLLTQELMPLLKEALESRIIVVSSGAHKAGKIHFDDLQLAKGYSAFKAYSQSKLANLLYVKAMAEELKGTSITINALHPGAVGTNMGVNRETGFGKGIMKILGKLFLTPEEGARTTVYLAVSPEVKDLSGGYYYKEKLSKISKIAQDMEVVRRFYTLSQQLVEDKIKNQNTMHTVEQKQLRWCAIGDSFTYLNDHLDQTDYRVTRGYLTRVCDELPYLKLKNMGINGSTTQDWLLIRIARADLYTILLGTNDWKCEIPVGDELDFINRKKGTILGNLGLIIDNIRKASPDAPIIVFNPVERGDFVYINDYHNVAPGSYQQLGNQMLTDVAKKIYHCVQGENVFSVDLNMLCGFHQDNVIKFKRVRTENGFQDLPYPDYVGISYDPDQDGYPYPVESIALTYDGLHPSDEGSAIIAEIVKEAIERVIKTNVFIGGNIC